MDRPYGMISQIVRKLMLYRSVIRHAQIRYVLSYDWVRSIIYRRTWHSMGVCSPVESWSDSHSFNDQRRGRSKPFKDERSEAEYVKIEHCTRKRRYILWYWMSDPRKARSSTVAVFDLLSCCDLLQRPIRWSWKLELGSSLQYWKFEFSSSFCVQRIGLRVQFVESWS